MTVQNVEEIFFADNERKYTAVMVVGEAAHITKRSFICKGECVC